MISSRTGRFATRRLAGAAGVGLLALGLSMAPSDRTPPAPDAAAAASLQRTAVGPGREAQGTSGKAGPAPAAPRRAGTSAPRARSSRPQGFATYYARRFEGRLTASGTRFDNDEMVAAHPRYPFGTMVRVTNMRNGKSVDVEIVDRGPARGPRASGVVIDLSRAAAEKLDFIRAGRTRVRLQIVPSDETDD